jgi:hypothetical protein
MEVTVGFWSKLFGGDEAEPVEYRGYFIHPAPMKIARVYGPPQLEDRSGKWQLHLYISKSSSDDAEAKEFQAANTYKSKGEATRHCIEFGKQIIDGKIESATLKDL